MRKVEAFLYVVLLGLGACTSPGAPPADAVAVAPNPPAPAPVTANPASSTPTASPASAAPSAALPVAAAVPASPAATGPVAAPNDYRIGPQDLLKIEVFGVPDLSRSVRVNASGQIALPLIGLVQAAGLTGEQLAAAIADALAKDYLQNPQVTIFIEEFTSQRVTVVGAVKSPGVYPIKGRTTLLQVVAAAGDPTTVAKRGAVRVLRNEPNGTRRMLEYDMDAIREGSVPDPEVIGEDVVQVETSTVKATAKQVMEFVMPFWWFR